MAATSASLLPSPRLILWPACRGAISRSSDLFQEVQDLADRQHTNVVDPLRRFTRLGLLAARKQETPGAALIIREGETEQRVLLL